MNPRFRIWLPGLIAALSLSCLSGCGSSAGSQGLSMPQSDSSQSSASSTHQSESSYTKEESSAVPALPDPMRILSQANVSTISDVELEIDGDTYLFDQYIYDCAASGNLVNRSDFLAYQMLVQAEDMTLEYLSGDGTYSEYAILWGEYLLGYLATDSSQWVLYLSGNVALNSTPNGGNSGSFQNDSFGITVRPGEVVPDTSYGTMRCESCNGSGRCDACSGDGLADNMYYGEPNAYKCSVCSGTGICPVCDGTGVWEFD